MVQSTELEAIDSHFGAFAARLSAVEGEGVFLAAALTSMATRSGHACLDLSAWAAGSVVVINGCRYRCPELSLWLAELSASSAIGGALDVTPLVLEDDRLYLRRYWEYEDEVAKFVIGRAKNPDAEVAMGFLVEAMARLFPGQPSSCDWQRLAALAVVLRPFAVITGGPGTGKTTTVARIIALLIEQQRGNEMKRIALAAPTGKAVMRLQVVMDGIKRNLACTEQIRELIPTKVITLHRLLGGRKGSPFFKHDAKNQLPYDLVVVDEASMVDLPLMAKLMRALRPETKLVLLGDRNQLASVEPGAVLGDICNREALPAFSRDFLAKAAAVTCVNGLEVGGNGQADSLVELQASHRFGADSGIDLVGQAITRGDANAALVVFQDENYPDVVWRDIRSGEQLRQELASRFMDCPPGWFGLDDPAQALQRLGSCQVLCAVRQSPFGVNLVNGYIEEALLAKWRVVPGGLGYPGRPVQIVVNNYELQLYNGDTGIILADPAKEGALQVFFPAGASAPRKIPLALLPDHETAYAMTVHKSQGSEFDEVVIILPDWQSAVLSRELLYTALTRARQKVEVWGRVDIFEGTVQAAISRHGGLRDKLRVV